MGTRGITSSWEGDANLHHYNPHGSDHTRGTRYYFIPDRGQELRTDKNGEALPDRIRGVRTYLYLNGERVAVNNLYNTNHGQYYYGSDILGSVKFITGQAGQELKRIEYDVFGGIYKGNSPYGLETGYTGKPYDSVTGLSDYGFRDYSPAYARFMTEDPIRDGENWFAYAGNNPVNWVDPWGLYSKDKINAFSKSSGEEQMAFLKQEYKSVQGENHTDADRGAKAAAMRALRDSMKLKELFKQDESFMNNELRDFVNLKEDGTMDYLLSDLTTENGWEELCSIGSQYHQSNAGDGNHLNAKFVNKDGREVVISRDGVISTSYPDKGTFNYVNGTLFSSILWGGHNLYDIKPYEKLMSGSNITTTKKYNGSFSGGAWYGNSHYWQ